MTDVGNETWEIVRKLGSGGMAEVFLAWECIAGERRRLVVVKALHTHLLGDESVALLFEREARTSAFLAHPNIIRTFGVRRLADGRPCIVMEFLRGRDLWFVLRRVEEEQGIVGPRMAAAIVSQAATGLHHAHVATDPTGTPLTVIHRDVSPHNLFITRGGSVRVLDFGIARVAGLSQTTRAGEIRGKLQYMSPEQARGAPLDHRADQFALGVVLWEMVTGKRLFGKTDPILILNALLYDPIPKPSSIVPDIPPPLEEVIMRSLTRDREGRFDSTLLMANALRTWLRTVEQTNEHELIAGLLESVVPSTEDPAYWGLDRDEAAVVQQYGDATPDAQGFSPTTERDKEFAAPTPLPDLEGLTDPRAPTFSQMPAPFGSYGAIRSEIPPRSVGRGLETLPSVPPKGPRPDRELLVWQDGSRDFDSPAAAETRQRLSGLFASDNLDEFDDELYDATSLSDDSDFPEEVRAARGWMRSRAQDPRSGELPSPATSDRPSDPVRLGAEETMLAPLPSAPAAAIPSARTTGAQSIPARTTGPQVVPARTTGPQVVPARTTGAQSVPVGGARTTGAQQVPARTTGAQRAPMPVPSFAPPPDPESAGFVAPPGTEPLVMGPESSEGPPPIVRYALIATAGLLILFLSAYITFRLVSSRPRSERWIQQPLIGSLLEQERLT